MGSKETPGHKWSLQRVPSNHQDPAHQLLSPWCTLLPAGRDSWVLQHQTLVMGMVMSSASNQSQSDLHPLGIAPGIVLTDKLWRSCPVDEFHTLRRKLLTAVMTVASYRSQATMVTFSLVTLSSPDATLFLRKSAI